MPGVAPEPFFELGDARLAYRADFRTAMPALRRGRPPFPAAPRPFASRMEWCLGQYTGTPLPGYPTGAREGDPQYAAARIGNQADVWPTLQAAEALGVSLVEARPGGMALRSVALTDAQRAMLPAAQSACTHASGALDSYPYAVFPGSYVEVVAQIPAAVCPGLFPCPLWLLTHPAPAAGYFEVDAAEMLSRQPGQVHHGLLTDESGHRESFGQWVGTLDGRALPDLSLAPHRYGIAWTRDTIRWTVDRRVTLTLPTPATGHVPARVLMDLAVGGSWAGAPDATTPFPAELIVQELSIWTLGDAA